jgi:hypothetical protein
MLASAWRSASSGRLLPLARITRDSGRLGGGVTIGRKLAEAAVHG